MSMQMLSLHLFRTLSSVIPYLQSKSFINAVINSHVQPSAQQMGQVLGIVIHQLPLVLVMIRSQQSSWQEVSHARSRNNTLCHVPSPSVSRGKEGGEGRRRQRKQEAFHLACHYVAASRCYLSLLTNVTSPVQQIPSI